MISQFSMQPANPIGNSIREMLGRLGSIENPVSKNFTQGGMETGMLNEEFPAFQPPVQQESLPVYAPPEMEEGYTPNPLPPQNEDLPAGFVHPEQESLPPTDIGASPFLSGEEPTAKGGEMTVYHATTKDFSKFKLPKTRGGSGEARAVFFADTPEATKYYQRDGGRIIEANISKDAKIFDYKQDVELINNYVDKLSTHNDSQKESLKRLLSSGEWGTIESEKFQTFLKKNGYDGFRVKDMTGNEAIGITNTNKIKIKSKLSPKETAKGGEIDPKLQAFMDRSKKIGEKTGNTERNEQLKAEYKNYLSTFKGDNPLSFMDWQSKLSPKEGTK